MNQRQCTTVKLAGKKTEDSSGRTPLNCVSRHSGKASRSRRTTALEDECIAARWSGSWLNCGITHTTRLRCSQWMRKIISGCRMKLSDMDRRSLRCHQQRSRAFRALAHTLFRARAPSGCKCNNIATTMSGSPYCAAT
eukprot:1628521-Pleurochrysis_carterae.AAC.6